MQEQPERFGRYLLLHSLKRTASMGELHQAYDGQTGRIVVVKRVRAPANRPDLVARFRDETNVAARLDHPNLVKVLDWGEVHGQAFIAFEWVTGRDLDALCQRARFAQRAIPEIVVAIILRQMCAALAFAHRVPGLNFIHRDVSPANVVVGFDGTVRLLDYGLAQSSLKRTHTMPGFFASGTPGFKSPEQRRGEPLDATTDLWSLGAVGYFLVAQRHVYHPRRSEAETLEPVLALSATTQEAADISPAFEQIISRALAERSARFQTADEMGAQLDRVIAASKVVDPRATVADTLGWLFPQGALDSRVEESVLAQQGADLIGVPTHSPTTPATLGAPQVATAKIGGRSRRQTVVVGALATLSVLSVVATVAVLRVQFKRDGQPPALPAVATPVASFPNAPTPRVSPPAVTTPPIAERHEAPDTTAAAPSPPPIATQTSVKRTVTAHLSPMSPPALHHTLDTRQLLATAQDQFDNGAYAEVVKTTTHAIEADAKANAFSLRGAAELRLNRADAAANDFKRALALDPSNQDAQAGLRALRAIP